MFPVRKIVLLSKKIPNLISISFMKTVSAREFAKQLQIRKLSNGVKPKTAIVMVNMGGPQSLDQVHDYLKRIMTDKDMIQLPFGE